MKRNHFAPRLARSFQRGRLGSQNSRRRGRLLRTEASRMGAAAELLEDRWLLSASLANFEPGLKSFLGQLQTTADGQTFSRRLPLIGNGLSQANASQVFQQIANTINPGTVSSISDVVNDLNSQLSSLGITASNPNPGNNLTGPDMIEFELQLTGSTQFNLPFDIGIPALNLTATGNV